MEEWARSDYCDLGRALSLIAFGIIMAVIQRLEGAEFGEGKISSAACRT